MIKQNKKSINEVFDEINEAKDILVKAFAEGDAKKIMTFSPDTVEMIFVVLEHFHLFTEKLKEANRTGNALNLINENKMFIGLMRDILTMWASELKRGEIVHDA